MSGILGGFFNKKNQDNNTEDEDVKAFEKQNRDIQQAKEIMRLMDEERKRKGLKELASHGGISILAPDIDISKIVQEELDRAYRKSEEIQKEKKINEDEIAKIPIRKRKQALNSMKHTVDVLENISKFYQETKNKENSLSIALKNIMSNGDKLKCVGSQAIEVLFNETSKIFNQNADLIEKISNTEQEMYKLRERMKGQEHNNNTLIMENDSLKQQLEYENNESNKHLRQVHRLQQKLDEFKRMQNEEFYKVKRDELKIRKKFDDIKLKYQRSQEALNKFQQKEDDILELQEYFEDKKKIEETERINTQLQYEKDKFSLLGLLRHKDKRPILCLLEYLELPDLNKLSMLNKNYNSVL